jgi:hypothetical protein
MKILTIIVEWLHNGYARSVLPKELSSAIGTVEYG